MNRNVHEHGPSCAKNEKGKTGCRYGAPFVHGSRKTSIVQVWRKLRSTILREQDAKLSVFEDNLLEMFDNGSDDEEESKPAPENKN